MGGYVPPLRRKDSFGMHFTFYPSMGLVSEILYNKMNLTIDNIVGVQNISNNRVVIKVVPHKFEEIMDEYEDKEIVINAGVVRVINLSNSFSYVSIRNAPFELENDILQELFSRYGKVYEMRMNRFSTGPFTGLFNGVRTAKMIIKQNIPSSVTIRGHNIAFLYNGQIKTCFKCGLTGHLAKDCEVAKAGRPNIFEEEDFPEINGMRKKKDVLDTPDTEDEDVHKTMDTDDDMACIAASEGGDAEATEKRTREDKEEQNTGNKITEAEVDVQQVQDMAQSEIQVIEVEVHHAPSVDDGQRKKGVNQDSQQRPNKRSKKEVTVKELSTNEAKKEEEEQQQQQQKELQEEQQEEPQQQQHQMQHPIQQIPVGHERINNEEAAWCASAEGNSGLKMKIKKEIVKEKNICSNDVPQRLLSSDEEICNNKKMKKN